MNPNIPSIEQLQEIALPAPVSYAPQTWGWWVLLALLMGAGLLVGARRYWQWRRDRYRREAMARLAELEASDDPLQALRELPELLKRVAISMPVGTGLLAMATSRSTSAVPDTPPSPASRRLQMPGALGGEDWQVFLQQHINQPLPADFSQQLARLAYAPDAVVLAVAESQRQQLFDTCRHWVEHHHVAA